MIQWTVYLRPTVPTPWLLCALSTDQGILQQQQSGYVETLDRAYYVLPKRWSGCCYPALMNVGTLVQRRAYTQLIYVQLVQPAPGHRRASKTFTNNLSSDILPLCCVDCDIFVQLYYYQARPHIYVYSRETSNTILSSVSASLSSPCRWI